MSKLPYKVAVLYQAHQPPVRDGLAKPMKPNGYADSGADIAFTLREKGIAIVVPVENPDVKNDLDWVFPDTEEGITQALSLGADTLWLNTVLYRGHVIEQFLEKGIFVVGQDPETVDRYDDKVATNKILSDAGLPIPPCLIVRQEQIDSVQPSLAYPMIVKPIRGRGSQGVSLVNSPTELNVKLKDIFANGEFGSAVYIEQYLPGEELTVTVMPPGKYMLEGLPITYDHYWALPAVRRFNHENGVAPYNGQVAIIHNSTVLKTEEEIAPSIRELYKLCQKAAELVSAKAPIRIDCRADSNDQYFLFDLNMKPNMTGASRPHRADQDSLTALSARRLNWDFGDLLLAMLGQRWNKA